MNAPEKSLEKAPKPLQKHEIHEDPPERASQDLAPAVSYSSASTLTRALHSKVVSSVDPKHFIRYILRLVRA